MPCLARRRQTAVPIPPMPPVTKAILCFSCLSVSPAALALVRVLDTVTVLIFPLVSLWFAAAMLAPRGSALDGKGHAHAASDTQRRESLPRVAPHHFMDQRHQDAAARCADRMPEGDGAAVDVDL